MSKSSTPRLGIIGCGNRVRGLARRLQEHAPQIRTVAVHDPLEHSVERARRELNASIRVHAKVADLVKDPEVDWVLVGSWNCLHREHAIAALEAGKHVFCEKPLATNLEDCLAIREAWQRSGKTFFFGFCLRYSPFYRKLHELVRSGVLGEIVSLEFNETLAFNHGGYIMGNWRRLRRNAGTHMLEKCCHDIDIANWLTESLTSRAASFGGLNFFLPENEPHMDRLGEDAEGRRAYCTWPDPGRVNPFTDDKDIVDNQVAILEYANGIRASFHANCQAALPERRFYIVGAEGTLRGDARQGRIECARVGFDEPVQVYTVNVGGGHGGADEGLIADLARTMTEGAPPPTGVDEGIRAAITCFGIDQALDDGRVIDMAPLWEKAGLAEPAGAPA